MKATQFAPKEPCRPAIYHILLIRTDHTLPDRTMSIYEHSDATETSRLVECDAVFSDKQFAMSRIAVVIFRSNSLSVLDCLT